MALVTSPNLVDKLPDGGAILRFYVGAGWLTVEVEPAGETHASYYEAWVAVNKIVKPFKTRERVTAFVEEARRQGYTVTYTPNDRVGQPRKGHGVDREVPGADGVGGG